MIKKDRKVITSFTIKLILPIIKPNIFISLNFKKDTDENFLLHFIYFTYNWYFSIL